MLKEYCVNVPVAGYAEIQVTASNEQEAISKALKRDICLNNVVELTACDRMSRNNSFNASADRKCIVSPEMDCDNMEIRREFVEYMEYINAVDAEL